METTQQQQTIRTVFVGTYCPAGTLSSYYVNSLADTIKQCLVNGIRIMPLFINDIASAVVAKNEMLAIVQNQDYESIVFIDHNMAWDSGTLINVINSQYDAMALPSVKKVGNGAIFDLEIGSEIARDQNGYIKVNYASTAMFKLSSKLVTELCDSNLSITNPTGNEVKNVFDTTTQTGRFFNEGVVLCNKIRALGHDIWVNPVSTCANIADNIYAADFAASIAPQVAPAITDEIKTLYA